MPTGNKYFISFDDIEVELNEPVLVEPDQEEKLAAEFDTRMSELTDEQLEQIYLLSIDEEQELPISQGQAPVAASKEKSTDITSDEKGRREVEKTEDEIKVEKLRAQEQAEKDATDPSDKKKLEEIYGRYDKLITPLLKRIKERKAKQAQTASPTEIEAGRQEVSAVKKGEITTTNPIRLFKGLFGKRNLDGTHKSAHPNVKGVFSAVDEKIAERYRGEDGIGTFDIPAGTTIETIRLQNKNVPVSKFREQETEAINASDAQIVKLITLDAKGAEEQYIIKDPALIKMMQKPEDATKAEPKEEVKKEKKTPPQNVLDIAKETGLSPQEIENTYKKYDDTKSIEEITVEDYNSARAAGNEQKLENSKKAFEALLKADSDSPTAKKKVAKIKEEVSKETLKEASDIMNNIDDIRQQLLDAGVIKSINCKWGK
jgi:hypothetical protein